MRSLLLALAAVGVHSHGGIFNYTIDGIDYPGHFPWLPEGPQSTIQRRWWGDPIRSPSHPYLACNRGNPLATKNPSLHAPIRAGSTIIANLHHPECPPGIIYPTKPSVPGDEDPPVPVCMGPLEGFWFHTHGPLIVYMADCQGSCEDFTPGPDDKRWFKIWESGLQDGRSVVDVDGWEQFPMTNNGWEVKIPKSLKAGRYLVRHEIIYIENDPAQFYPYCTQVEVIGEGKEIPGEEYLVAFPGGYKAVGE
ncbi:hypothetical protein OQA88_5276 [Cercophora sp. LCS_1]